MLLESPSATELTALRPALIETLRSDDAGTIPLLARHLQRLEASARTLGYPCPRVEIEHALLDTARRQQGGAHRLRLLLHHTGHFELHSQPLPAPVHAPTRLLIGLANLTLHTPNSWRHYKTTHRPEYERAQAWLQAHPDYFDCIFVNQHGQLCEGSRSNLYLYLDRHWYTPPLVCGVLPGIMRELLLESGQACERLMGVHELKSAKAWRMSNAVHGWVDVHFDHSPTAPYQRQ